MSEANKGGGSASGGTRKRMVVQERSARDAPPLGRVRAAPRCATTRGLHQLSRVFRRLSAPAPSCTRDGLERAGSSCVCEGGHACVCARSCTRAPPVCLHAARPAVPAIAGDPSSPASAWIETLRSHARSNSFHSALSPYVAITSAGVHPDNFIFPAVIKSAGGLHDLAVGLQLHAASIKFGQSCSPVAVPNSLITMYAKCGDIGDALKVFDRIPEPDQVSWNSIIAALCVFEEWVASLDAFRIMQEEGFGASSFTLVSVSLACSGVEKYGGLRLAKELHGHGCYEEVADRRRGNG
ncbi:Pentatricopeptide repeat-containing protein [Platanthera zijinensis]|uniref:Pentatricopeptide repeat-containing protein n=1 Tax=Platanthera zijinensis TaxID=2320716 RepID=A0AAP0AWK0_9ASPA